MLSTEEIILKNALSLLNPLKVTGIFCVARTFAKDFGGDLSNALCYPKSETNTLGLTFLELIDQEAHLVFNEPTPSPFLSYLWARDKRQQTGKLTAQTYILTQAYGPKGLSALFLLGVEDGEKLPNNSVLEHVQQITQTAFLKIALLGTKYSQPVRLTPREKVIVKWIAFGKSNSEIAEIMGISIHTVNGYLRAIYLKTQTSDRVSIGFYALHNGLLD